MKTLSDKFYLSFFFLFGTLCSIAGTDPPPPSPTGKVAGVPPPPGLPIDENIFVLFGIAILLGIYIIYKNDIKTKYPI
ncbi:hypothetical protein [Flavobacterium sp.]|uniref:hypothetical protein n=1 Tax=Flavobacterium sp. TaxID=239 RepID=UPI002F3E5C70